MLSPREIPLALTSSRPCRVAGTAARTAVTAAAAAAAGAITSVPSQPVSTMPRALLVVRPVISEFERLVVNTAALAFLAAEVLIVLNIVGPSHDALPGAQFQAEVRRRRLLLGCHFHHCGCRGTRAGRRGGRHSLRGRARPPRVGLGISCRVQVSRAEAWHSRTLPTRLPPWRVYAIPSAPYRLIFRKMQHQTRAHTMRTAKENTREASLYPLPRHSRLVSGSDRPGEEEAEPAPQWAPGQTVHILTAALMHTSPFLAPAPCRRPQEPPSGRPHAPAGGDAVMPSPDAPQHVGI